jgi:starch phosphorylase
VLYLTLEIGLDTALPTYSGGLGVLAGDHVRAAADLGVPLVAVSLWYRSGVGLQRLDSAGNQRVDRPRLEPERLLEDTGMVLDLVIGGRNLPARVFVKQVVGRSGDVVPVYFLDVGPGAVDGFGEVNEQLYGGGVENRIRQEAVLGAGALALSEALGLDTPVLHLNEGHCALAAWGLFDGDVDAVRDRCRFTTHTPVAAGHDTFSWDLVEEVLGTEATEGLKRLLDGGGGQPVKLNMSHLAARLSGSVNGVSICNAQVAPDLFPPECIPAGVRSVTNGVHLSTWCVESMQVLFDTHLAGWRDDHEVLRQAPKSLPDVALGEARAVAKADLVELANARCLAGFDVSLPLIGFARRMTGYKRANLLLRDRPRLEAIAAQFGGLQVLFAGRAHPADSEGQSILRELVQAVPGSQHLRIAVLDGYSLREGRLLTGGVDVWLNNPVRPLEASGTSGMKAVLQGVPNLSIPDGWWLEGCRHGVNGWVFGATVNPDTGRWSEPTDRDDDADADSLYAALETQVLPLITASDPTDWRAMQSQAIATAPDFSARRMVRDYVGAIYPA